MREVRSIWQGTQKLSRVAERMMVTGQIEKESCVK